MVEIVLMVVCTIFMAIFNILATYRMISHKKTNIIKPTNSTNTSSNASGSVEMKLTIYSFIIFVLQLMYMLLYFKIIYAYQPGWLRVYLMYGDAFSVVHPFLLFVMSKKVRELFSKQS
jgi:hypothetical protein